MEAQKALSETELKNEYGPEHIYRNTLPSDADAFVIWDCGRELQSKDWAWPQVTAKVGLCNTGRNKVDIPIEVGPGLNVTDRLIQEIDGFIENLDLTENPEAEEGEAELKHE